MAKCNQLTSVPIKGLKLASFLVVTEFCIVSILHLVDMSFNLTDFLLVFDDKD